MNDRQKEFIKILKKHLAQKVSIAQMNAWLTEYIKPSIFLSKAYMRPGMWLEMYAYREIHWHIVDLENSKKGEETNPDWYLKEAKRILDFLVGESSFKRTEYRIEPPINNRPEEDIQSMLPYLKYAEEVASLLTESSFENDTSNNLPKLNTNFEPAPISSRTCAEFLMEEILNTIGEYMETVEHLRHHSPDNYYSSELKIFQISQLKKLLQCFRGELRYSISVSFEGLDKVAITILV